MSETTTTAVVEEATVKAATKAGGKKASKKAAPKKASKKAAPKKAAAKKATKKEGVGRAKKEGLRNPQVRILAALAKHGEMTRAAIAEKAPVDVATCVEYVGSDDEAKRLANDKKHFPSLVSLGFVKQDWYPNKETDAQGPTHYTITAAGKKALEAAKKA